MKVFLLYTDNNKKEPYTSSSIYLKSFISTNFSMVRVKGLEPPCRKALDPKSSASANFATLAYKNGGPCRTRTYDRPVMSRML